MKATEIAFVCYGVTDLPRARDFYENKLGLKVGSEWMKDDGTGFIEYWIGAQENVLAIGAGADNFKPGKEGPCVAIEVEDFDKAVQDLKAKGVKFLFEEAWDTPVCHMTLIEDPDGNQIMIHQRKG